MEFIKTYQADLAAKAAEFANNAIAKGLQLYGLEGPTEHYLPRLERDALTSGETLVWLDKTKPVCFIGIPESEVQTGNVSISIPFAYGQEAADIFYSLTPLDYARRKTS